MQPLQSQAWGRLSRIDPDNDSHILLVNSEWTIGRRKGCDLSFPGNKLVSGDHCKIIREHTGRVWLEDTSTNGTVINKSKVVKKQTYPLQNGDAIYVVYRKNEPDQNVAYLYKALNCEEESQDDPMENDGTSEALQRTEDQSSNVRHEDQGTLEGKQPDKMEETLTCIICQDLLHDCVSLQPCMHSFCAACYSGWMERSSLCPTCRCPVERISKNHMVNNLVEAYLLQHPEKCRSGEELQSMDARNKITHDMLQPKIKRSFSDEEVSSEDFLELSDVDSESSDISQPYIVCRQCPGYRAENNQTTFLQGQHSGTCELPAFRPTGDAPSTSTSSPVTVQEYTCPGRGPHIICTCCFQPMPDRRAEREPNATITPQQCTICLRPFCHMYWGCSRVGCSGCLARFCDVNFGEKCLDGIFNNNTFESDILKNYLASRGLTWKEMLQESLLALQRGTFVLTDYNVSTNTVLCYCCGLHNFRELTYQYRQNIPKEELPGSVTARPDCYWGRNCRTQVKAHHAMKFNHICEQTRFKH
ncbi:E3 ubiquitin-protein ligase CHFR isoform X2 [Amblyraja radiata]|uniref:E3 ubiquitin-protein ligase CHFR isoform X2 n=1 Tax=Amblyraja radiata TaxID=386614 RepID=UPI00140304DD|nr:E3 ubiquitin-protein ligase CHFR isoform X2 [Amblyraja radiata]XP_055511497.1 E3 ubiquitin-protein ligase CHFR isoform X2 [Leucoraja erinacea]